MAKRRRRRAIASPASRSENGVDAITRAVLWIIGDIPSLVPEEAMDDYTPSAKMPVSENMLYDFLVDARRLYDCISEETLTRYEATLDETEWLAAVAWCLFRTATDDVNEAVMRARLDEKFLFDLRTKGIAARDAAALLMDQR